MSKAIKSNDPVTLESARKRIVIRDREGKWMTIVSPVRRGVKGLKVRDFLTGEPAFIPESRVGEYSYA